MTEEFHDPGWWTAPPDPPKHISSATIVLGTIVPIAAIAILVVALVTHKSHSKTAGRSLTAFQACLSDQGVMTSSAESNDAMLRQAAVACRTHAPVIPRSADHAKAVQQAIESCMQEAASKLRTGAVRIGPFVGRPSRQAYENAAATCRAESMVEGGGVPPTSGSPDSSGSVA